MLDLMNCAGTHEKYFNRLILLRNGKESEGFAGKAEELGKLISSMKKLDTKVY